MKIDSGFMTSLEDVPARARRLEADGFDGLITAEIAHDPFLPLALAAEHTERIELMQERGEWKEGQSIYGLRKTRVKL